MALRGVARRMNKAVFLDRDDTLMEARSLPPPPLPAAPGDVVDPALVRLLPGAAESCRRLKRAGYLLVVVTNQGVVARGGATLEQAHAVNRRLAELIGPGMIDTFYSCPFHPKGSVPEFTREHPWRKPAPGMILAAAGQFHINLAASWLIGDADRDIAAGMAAGIASERCLLLGTEVASISDAADRILAVG